jgi:hypothetical protein
MNYVSEQTIDFSAITGRKIPNNRLLILRQDQNMSIISNSGCEKFVSMGNIVQTIKKNS